MTWTWNLGRPSESSRPCVPECSKVRVLRNVCRNSRGYWTFERFFYLCFQIIDIFIHNISINLCLIPSFICRHYGYSTISVSHLCSDIFSIKTRVFGNKTSKKHLEIVYMNPFRTSKIVKHNMHVSMLYQRPDWIQEQEFRKQKYIFGKTNSVFSGFLSI